MIISINPAVIKLEGGVLVQNTIINLDNIVSIYQGARTITAKSLGEPEGFKDTQMPCIYFDTVYGKAVPWIFIDEKEASAVFQWVCNKLKADCVDVAQEVRSYTGLINEYKKVHEGEEEEKPDAEVL